MNNYILKRFEAYEKKINITLFNEFISFVLSSSEQANYDFQNQLPSECIWYCKVNNIIPDKLGFRYPGEMLERYEERCGSDIRDIRAIALALGYTTQIHETQMFIGGQKSDFIYRIRKLAEDDFYLQIALYYLDGQKSEDFNRLISKECTETEDVLLQVWLYPDPESAFDIVKEKLVKAYSTERTISAIHNAALFSKVLKRFYYVLRDYRKKDVQVLKRIFLLKDALFKPDSKEYNDMLEFGYSEDEIRYLNFVLADYTDIPSKITEGGITDEKIAVEFCRHFLNSPETHSENTYGLIQTVLKDYSKFKVKYEENNGIIAALCDTVDIVNPITFARVHEKMHSDFVKHFDITDDKWNPLATELVYEEYWQFISDKIAEIKDIDTVKLWLDKFEALTGRTYISRFDANKDMPLSSFKHLVKVGYLNLMEYYEQMLTLPDENIKGENTRSNRRYYIRKKVEDMYDRQDFEFFREFFKKYGNDDLNKGLGISRFYEGFAIGYSYSGDSIGSLRIKRDFLSNDEQCEVLGWLDSYIFEKYISLYTSFVKAILQNDDVLSLYCKEDIRKLYLAYCQINKDAAEDYTMIKKFLTVKEIEDYDNRQREKARLKELEALAREKADAENDFEKNRDSWDGLCKVFDRHFYRSRKEFLCEIARSKIKELIETLPIRDNYEFEKFLTLQIAFLEREVFTHDEIMDNIFLAKEYMNYETDNTETIAD